MRKAAPPHGCLRAGGKRDDATYWSRWISTPAVDYDIARLRVAAASNSCYENLRPPDAARASRVVASLRKKYDWRAVVLFYLGGVMIADVFCAGLILLLYRRHPGILTAPALWVPIGGMIGFGYGATKNKLSKGTALFKNKKEDASSTPA
jgi:hypothetical protein